VNLFVASQLEWPEKGLNIRQETKFPEQQGTSLIVSAKNPVQMEINLRIPYWAKGGSVKINGSELQAFSSPASYLALNRTWKSGDRIDLSLPMDLHIDPMPDDKTVQAVMYGPLVLAGKFDPVSKEMLYGDYEPKPTDQHKVPEITADAANPTAWVKPDSKSLTFVAEGQSQPITLVPLYQIIPERYAVYWKVNNKTA
jgi:DUF1680 family protein